MPTAQPLPEPMPHIGPILDPRVRPMRFDPLELAKVLSHYDLGVIEQLRAYKRGSPRAPKVRIRTRRGDFLLKRRAPGRDDPYRVAFAQSIQLHLQRHGYPDLVPRILARPPGEVFALALAAAKEMNWEIVAAVPEEGRIEAMATTFWFGFTDDVVVRVAAHEKGSRLDVRSVSRVGRSDIGVNARRIREFLALLPAREGSP